MATHQYRGQAPQRRTRRAGFSQASTRRPITLYDQHEREWSAQVGNKTGRPTGLISPNFRAPWVPDQQYLKVNPDNTSELFIDYPAMRRRRNARLNEFHKHAAAVARDANMPVPEKGFYSEDLLRRAGGMPKPVQPVIAAMQGNVYILGETYAAMRGLPYVVDPRLEPFVTRPTADEGLDEFDFSPETSYAEATRQADALEAQDRLRKNQDALTTGRTEPLEKATRTVKPTAQPIKTREDREREMRAEAIAGKTPHGMLDDGEDGDQAEDEAGDSFDPTAAINELKSEALNEQYDPEAIGGKPVPVRHVNPPKSGAPRRPHRATNHATHQPAHKPSPKPPPRPASKPTSDAKKRQMANRPTLASGAAPVIGDGSPLG